MFVSDKVFCGKSGLEGKGVLSKQDISKGERILQFTGVIIPENDYKYALQIDDDKYLLNNSDEVDNFVNHSCDPNCYVDHNGFFLTTLRNVRRGEELCFHYCISEYDLGISSFKCNCDSESCLGEIKGFKYLSYTDKFKLSEFLFPYLLRKL